GGGEAGGLERGAGGRVVRPGGSPQLTGARERAHLVLDKQVRRGRPLRISGLAEATAGPAFSTAAGLIAYAIQREGELKPPQKTERADPQGLFERGGGGLRGKF